MEKLNKDTLLEIISKKLIKKKIPVHLKKNDFIEIIWNNGIGEKRRIFGKCIGYNKNGFNSTIKLLYLIDNYRIIETFPLYSNSLIKITLFKKDG